MKRIHYLLILLLSITTLTSCEIFSPDNETSMKLSEDTLTFYKNGGEQIVKTNTLYNFHMIKVQGDTILWTEDDTYKEKSIQRGYTFERNNIIIKGDGLTLNGHSSTQFQVILSPNTSEETKKIVVVVSADNPNYTRKDSVVITQKY